MAYITKTGFNTTKSDSLKTTIPQEIADKLNIKKGDNLVWVLSEDETSVCIKKLEV
ncbi:MAG: AbrB/MazE/SpoVT family DNA-binding domain-containing protein [Methanobrevibacter sp.]|nr:AbrB/MazE/SpoVT family DNA-binding domain-containing protein [Methanobrevibacter sp.]